jgi:hypothetical protein
MKPTKDNGIRTCAVCHKSYHVDSGIDTWLASICSRACLEKYPIYR